MIIDILGLVFSATALAFSIVGYCIHDKKIKQQEVKLNAFQLKKFEEEEKENKMACVKGRIIKEAKGKRILKVYNSGKSIAYNVRLEYLSDLTGLYINDHHFPLEMLDAQDGSEIVLSLSEGVNSLKVKFIWDDEFKKDNEFTQLLTF